MALRDVLVKFGIDVSGRQQLLQTDADIRRTILSAERFGNTLKRLGSFLLVGTIANGIKNFMSDLITQADQLKHNAERLGLTTDELQKYQYAASLVNVSTQETAVAMRYFNRAVGEAVLGTKQATKTFGTLGINIRDAQGNVKPTSDLLGEFADKLQKIPSQAERTAYAMRMLGRNGAQFLPVLQKGGKEIRAIFKDVDDLGGGFNKQFVESAHEVDVALKRLKFAYRSVFVAIASEILPIFRRWVERSIETAKHIIDLAKHTYGLRTALLALGSGAVIYAVTRLLKLFNPFKASIKDIMVALLANAPLVIFIGLLTAAYLVFDDFYTFLKGGKSVFGDFLDQIGGKGASTKFLVEIKDAFHKIWDALAPMKGGLEDIGKGMLRAFADTVPYIIKWGGQFTLFVVKAIDAAWHGLKELGMLLGGLLKSGANLITGDTDAAGKALSDAWDASEKDNANFEKQANAIDHAMDVFNSIGQPSAPDKSAPAGAADSLNDFWGGGKGAPQKVNVHVVQHINGAKDPAAVGREATRGVGTAVKNAASQLRDAHAAVGVGLPIPSGY